MLGVDEERKDLRGIDASGMLESGIPFVPNTAKAPSTHSAFFISRYRCVEVVISKDRMLSEKKRNDGGMKKRKSGGERKQAKSRAANNSKLHPTRGKSGDR